MTVKKHILVLNGSASAQSSNERLIELFKEAMEGENEVTSLLIPGIRGKLDESGKFKDEETGRVFQRFVDTFGRGLSTGVVF